MNRSVVSYGSLLISCLVLAPPAHGGSIEGRVVDAATGAPIQLVNVRLVGPQARNATITTADGAYRFVELRPGTYVVSFAHVAYLADERRVRVGTDPVVRADMALETGTFVLDEIRVRGDRLADERRFQSGFVGLEAKTLAGLPALGETDIIRGLQFLPGVQAASDVSSGLYVRGGGPDQTLILLDRFTLYNPTHAFGLFSTFNADAIDEVSLYKGAYPATFGGRLSSVLDVRQRSGGRERVKGRASLSTVAGSATFEGPLEGGSWLVGARRTYLDPILSAVRTDENPVPEYYFYDLNGKLRLATGGAGALEASAYVSRDDLHFDLDEGSVIDIDWGNTAVSARYRHILGSAVTTTALSVSDYRSSSHVSIFSTPIVFDNRVRDYTLTSELEAPLGERRVVGVGAELTGYEIGYVQSFNQGARVDILETPWSGVLFVQDEWEATASTSIRTGLRSRYFSAGDRFFLEPRLSVARTLGESLTLKMGGGIYNQVLQLVASEGFSGTDFYLPIDETASPGRSLQSVLGLEWSPVRAYRTSIEAYYTDLDDLVVFDNESAADRPGTTSADLFVTDGEGFATGVELFAERRVGDVTGWVGYTLGWTRRRFDSLNAGRAFPPKYDRRHDVNVVVNWTRGAWHYGASFVYATGQAFTPAAARYGIRNPATAQQPDGGQYLPAARNSARLLPYHRLDLSVRKDFTLLGRQAQWFVQVFNAYSRRNDWFVELDPSGDATEPRIVRQLPIIPSLGIRVEL